MAVAGSHKNYHHDIAEESHQKTLGRFAYTRQVQGQVTTLVLCVDLHTTQRHRDLNKMSQFRGRSYFM